MPPDGSVRLRTEDPPARRQNESTDTGIRRHSTMTLTDVKTLRAQARRHLEDGAVTAGYSADRAQVLGLLNEALATEMVCVLRYRRHHFMARGIDAKSTADEFMAHSNEEQGHADRIAERIVQLGGEPDFSPGGLLSCSHAEYVAGASLIEMIREDLVAERIAIDSYLGALRYLGDQDPTTSEMLKAILGVEERHADELADLLTDLPGRPA
jgi:bacterioferritin